MLFNLRQRRTRRYPSRAAFYEQRISLQLVRKCRRVRGARKYESVGYKWKASETRNDHRRCSIHRRAVFRWLRQISAWVGEVLPVDRRKTSTEFRLSKLQPAIRIFVTANTIVAGVAFRGDNCWDLLRCIECEPRKVQGGWIDSLNLPSYRRLYPDLERLWRNEVFDSFETWFRGTLLTADTLIIYGMREGPTWARLAASSASVEPHEIERLPVRIGYPDRVDSHDHL
ncbi:hypothetical protein [Paraburkholderia sp. BCC1885]|uniref:hypothetical protein n=1 Tax=Paraburkholderia sp. BCC1885 TaxID=2562669 RepID=UPI0011835C69|nr:hypothetical protein [Paraburkholderia sp. BCC1885]